MKKTKIVCTIGPASEEKGIFRQLVKNGLNVARLNFSHGDHEEHLQRINMIKEVREELNVPVAILLDTKGPEIRTGKFKDPEVYLEEGQTFTLTTRDVLGDKTICNISYDGLAKDVKPGDIVLIDDGLVGLRVEEVVNDTDMKCIVENAGEIKDHKGVNVPGVSINLPAVTEKDIDDIKFGIEQDIDFIAASFVRKSDDVLAIKKILEENNAQHIQIISKIENQEGVDNLHEIIRLSDGIMVARGDLGVEIPTEEMPLVQKEMIKQCNKFAKPVITATQMLDSMIRNPRPTRAEVTDVANAILDGTDAIMLSGETAAGKYPAEAVQTMTNIAKRIESSIDYRGLLKKKAIQKETTMTDAISNATCFTAMDLEASAIVTATASGYTARMVSKFRPKSAIIAATTKKGVMRKLSLMWGVYSVLTEEAESTDDIVDISVQRSLEEGFINRGEVIVITAGVPVGITGTTNLIKAHIVGDVILKGVGVGKTAFTGKVVILKDADEDVEITDTDILVTSFTNKKHTSLIEKAGALVTEEGGLTSNGAIIGLNLEKPTIVDAYKATIKLKDGDIITVDSKTGLIYSGETRVL